VFGEHASEGLWMGSVAEQRLRQREVRMGALGMRDIALKALAGARV
jgi:hypothetical protein